MSENRTGSTNHAGPPPVPVFDICRFINKQDRRPKKECVSWEVLVSRLTQHDLRDEKDGPLWSPTIYATNTTRKAQNVEAITLLVLDFDSGADPKQVSHQWELDGLAFAIHTTHSHSRAQPKWRAIFPLENPIAASEWANIYPELAARLGGNAADPSCKDVSRIYYFPSCPPDRSEEAFSFALPGAHLSIESIEGSEEKLPLPTAPLPAPTQNDRARNYVLSALGKEREKMLAASEGQRHRQRYNSAMALAGYFPLLSESEITDALAVNFGKDKQNALDAIADGIKNGKAMPRTLPISVVNSKVNGVSKSASAQQKSNDKVEGEEEFSFTFSTDDALDDYLSDIQWLWPQYIPRGFLTMIAAEQSQGKSTVAQSLVQCLIEGTRWPDGQSITPISSDQKMLWVDTEGGLAMFRQRLKDWGMPRNHFVFPEDPLKELMLDDPRDWRWIEAAIEHFSPPIVVFDSLSGSHRGEENSNDNMKIILKRLAELAQRRKIAILLIHHLNKAPFGVPEYPITLGRLRGASTITQFCRSVIALGVPDKNQPESRRLDVIKMNLGRIPKPIGYALTDRGPAWGVAPEVPQPKRAAEDAADFLREVLGEGFVPSTEVEAEARARSIGANSLKAAKKALGIKANREGGKNGRWFWSLPHQNTSREIFDE